MVGGAVGGVVVAILLLLVIGVALVVFIVRSKRNILALPSATNNGMYRTLTN